MQPERHDATLCGRKDQPSAIRRERESKEIVTTAAGVESIGRRPRASQRLRRRRWRRRTFAPVTNRGDREHDGRDQRDGCQNALHAILRLAP